MPASVAVAGGTASAKFAGTVGGGVDYFNVNVNASISGIAQSASFTIGMVPPKTLTCAPATLKAGQSSTCTYTLVGPAPAGESLTVLSSTAKLAAPSSTPVATGTKSGAFTVTALSGYSGPVSVTVKADGVPATATISAADTGPKTGAINVPYGLSCQPKLSRAGATVNCEVQLSSSSDGPSQVTLSSSDASVHIPAYIIGRPRQLAISFHATLDPSSPTQTESVQASTAGSTVEERISVQSSERPVLSVPAKQFATYGKKLSFQVTTSAGVLSASSLPEGATFNPATGTFDWTPSASQAGLFKVGFIATDAAGSASSEVQIQTGSGAPVLDQILNAASGSSDSVCSSGSLAMVRGGWLAPGPQVFVNGTPVQVVAISPTQVTFVCPSSASGTSLEVAVETPAGRSNLLKTVLRDTAPGIFTIDGSPDGQAAATIFGRSAIAMPRNHLYAGEPAQAGNTLLIPVTGIPADTDPSLLSVRIGDIEAIALSVQPIAPGVANIGVNVPRAAPLGAAVPVTIHYRSPLGEISATQTSTIAIEGQ